MMHAWNAKGLAVTACSIFLLSNSVQASIGGSDIGSWPTEPKETLVSVAKVPQFEAGVQIPGYAVASAWKCYMRSARYDSKDTVRRVTQFVWAATWIGPAVTLGFCLGSEG